MLATTFYVIACRRTEKLTLRSVDEGVSETVGKLLDWEGGLRAVCWLEEGADTKLGAGGGSRLEDF